MTKRIFFIGAASFLSLFLSACGIFENPDVPPPPKGEEWASKIKSSYPEWQPPREMPSGNPDYAAALKKAEEKKQQESLPADRIPTSVISIAEEKAAAAEAPIVPTSYIVKENDNLWNIAKSVYGNGEKWTVIYEANKEKIKNPNYLRPGLELLIPPVGK